MTNEFKNRVRRNRILVGCLLALAFILSQVLIHLINYYAVFPMIGTLTPKQELFITTIFTAMGIMNFMTITVIISIRIQNIDTHLGDLGIAGLNIIKVLIEDEIAIQQSVQKDEIEVETIRRRNRLEEKRRALQDKIKVITDITRKKNK